MIDERLLANARDRLVVIQSDERLTAVATQLGDPNIRLVIVCAAGGKMVGVISRTDIVRRIGQCTGCTCTETVQSAMVDKVLACRSSEPLDNVWKRMKDSGCSHLPVLDDAGRPVGILSAQDVLVSLLADQSRKEAVLLDYVRGVGYH